MKEEGGLSFLQVCKSPKLICAYTFLCFVLFLVMRLRNHFLVNKELSGGIEEMRHIDGGIMGTLSYLNLKFLK